MKKKIALLLAIVMLAMTILAACGAEHGVSREASDGEISSGEISGEAMLAPLVSDSASATASASESESPLEPSTAVNGEASSRETSSGKTERESQPSEPEATTASTTAPMSLSESASPQPAITSTPEATPTMEEIIDANIGIITGDASQRMIMHESELIDAHPDEFAEIVEFGEAALPYLDTIIAGKEADIEGSESRAIISFAAKYAIQPELFDRVFPSPDGKCVLKAPIYTFMDMFGTVDSGPINNKAIFVEAEKNVMVCEIGLDINTIDFLEADWSANSRFVAITHHFKRYTSVAIIDTQAFSSIVIPKADELIDYFGAEAAPFFEPEPFWQFYYFSEWVSNSCVKINFFWPGQGPGGEYDDPYYYATLSGWYEYDLGDDTIIAADFSPNRPWEHARAE